MAPLSIKKMFSLAYGGFEPGPPAGEVFYKCKIILKLYFQLHSGLFSFKKVQRVVLIIAQAQILAQNVRTKKLLKVVIVAVPNYAHHQSYFTFPEFVIVYL